MVKLSSEESNAYKLGNVFKRHGSVRHCIALYIYQKIDKENMWDLKDNFWTYSLSHIINKINFGI